MGKTLQPQKTREEGGAGCSVGRRGAASSGAVTQVGEMDASPCSRPHTHANIKKARERGRKQRESFRLGKDALVAGS